MLFGTATTHTFFLNNGGNRLLTESSIQVQRWLTPPSGPPEVLVGSIGGRAIVDGVFYETPVPSDHRTALGQPAVLIFDRGRRDQFPLTLTYALSRSFPVVADQLDVLGFSGPAAETLDLLSAYISNECRSGQAR